MPFIYERAKNVVICLEKITQDSLIGLQILKYLASLTAVCTTAVEVFISKIGAERTPRYIG
jgi:hypothetical protein